MWPKDVEDRRSTRCSVPESEVLLSFTSDDDAYAFRDWLQEVGWGKFHNWKALQ